MSGPTDRLAPNPARHQDVAVLIGILADLESLLMVGEVPEYMTERLKHQFVKVRLLNESGSERDLRQAINDLNQRLRYVDGAYNEPIPPVPVPD